MRDWSTVLALLSYAIGRVQRRLTTWARGNFDNRIYGGSLVSKVSGFIATCFLVWGGLGLLVFSWRVACVGAVGFLLFSLVGYRMSGGRSNPGLVDVIWERENRIDVVGDSVGTWRAKVEAMCSLLERDSLGDYGEALLHLKIRNVPPQVEEAYQAAVRNPSRESWVRLKAALIEHPPPGQVDKFGLREIARNLVPWRRKSRPQAPP